MFDLSQQLISKRIWLLALLSLSLVGCASDGDKPDFVAPVFPSPPEEPRFVYERSLISSVDVEEMTGSERFRMFATGASRGARGLIKPHSVAVHQGRVYVTDTIQRVVAMFDVPGRRFKVFGNEGQGILAKPIGIDVSSAGELFVTDSVAKRVVVFDREGNYLRAIGGKDYLTQPSGVAVNRAGTRLYVVDTGTVRTDDHRVQVFDAQSGEHLKTIGKRGTGEGEFNLPLTATTDQDGNLYVVDGSNFRIEKFTPDGEFLFMFGKLGRSFGQFARPKGIAVDVDKNIYVVDAAFGNFQIFTERGELLLFIGGHGPNEPAKYMLPSGIDVDEDGRIYVVDQVYRRVDVYRPYALRVEKGSLPDGQQAAPVTR